MNNYQLTEYAESIADDILAEIERNGGEPSDMAHEYADGSEHVIYYSKAHELCANCNTDAGEQFIEDIGGIENPTYDSLACAIAYGELLSRINNALHEKESI